MDALDSIFGDVFRAGAAGVGRVPAPALALGPLDDIIALVESGDDAAPAAPRPRADVRLDSIIDDVRDTERSCISTFYFPAPRLPSIFFYPGQLRSSGLVVTS